MPSVGSRSGAGEDITGIVGRAAPVVGQGVTRTGIGRAAGFAMRCGGLQRLHGDGGWALHRRLND